MISSLSREVLVKDGAALVNILASDNIKPFYEYESKVFRPYMLSKLRHHNRIDIVWDEYIARQLEDRDPKKRGKIVRRRVEPSAATIGPAKCKALPFFHVFTRCDGVSYFSRRGKKQHGVHGIPLKA